MALLFSLLACLTSQTTPQTSAPLEPAAVAVVAPTELSTFTLTLRPGELVYDESAGTVTASPGSAVQASSYSHYVLDLASLETALGGRPQEAVDVEIEVGPGERRVETPFCDMPQPDGGFEIVTFTGRVVRGP